MNLNQDNAGGDPVAVTASKITVTVAMGTDSGDTAARLQFTDDTGKSYCVASDWQGKPVSITDFNTACWEPAKGTAATLTTPIVAVHVIIPSTATAANPFGFCITNVELTP
jgi:hypothetical protein